LIPLSRNLGSAARTVGVLETNEPYVAFFDPEPAKHLRGGRTRWVRLVGHAWQLGFRTALGVQPVPQGRDHCNQLLDVGKRVVQQLWIDGG
jgi:hypothetical protein